MESLGVTMIHLRKTKKKRGHHKRDHKRDRNLPMMLGVERHKGSFLGTDTTCILLSRDSPSSHQRDALTQSSLPRLRNPSKQIDH